VAASRRSVRWASGAATEYAGELTAPNSTAPQSRAAASVAAGNAVPCCRKVSQPASAFTICKDGSSRCNTRTACGTTSRPMPSPLITHSFMP
jgi:hypothetical protein